MKIIIETKENPNEVERLAGTEVLLTVSFEAIKGDDSGAVHVLAKDKPFCCLQCAMMHVSQTLMRGALPDGLVEAMEDIKRRILSGEIRPQDMTEPDILPGDEWKHQ